MPIITEAKGSGVAEKTMASTTSANFTMPRTRLTSTSFEVSGPRRRLRVRQARVLLFSSSAISGATENTQLTSAQKVKIPKEMQITSAK